MSAGFDVAILGGSSGIGRAVAAAFLGRGQRVCVVGRTRREPTEVERVHADALGWIQADLSSRRDLEALGRALAARQPHTLIHCAGGISTAPEVTEDGAERRFVVNHLARVITTEAVLAGGSVQRLAYLTAWGTYRRAPRGYTYNKPGRGGLIAVRNAYIPNDAYFRELSDRRPELPILAYNPRATDGTGITDRPGVPRVLRGLTRAWFSLVARSADSVANELIAELERTAPGIRFVDGGKPVPAPEFTLEPRPWERVLCEVTDGS